MNLSYLDPTLSYGIRCESGNIANSYAMQHPFLPDPKIIPPREWQSLSSLLDPFVRPKNDGFRCVLVFLAGLGAGVKEELFERVM